MKTVNVSAENRTVANLKQYTELAQAVDSKMLINTAKRMFNLGRYYIKSVQYNYLCDDGELKVIIPTLFSHNDVGFMVSAEAMLELGWL